MSNILILDSRIIDLDKIIESVKIDVKYVVLDYYNDTFDSLINKINLLNIINIENVGLVRHGYYFSTYKLLDKQETPSLIYNVIVDDINLNSWYEIKNLLNHLINKYNLINFDFLSCRLDKYPEYVYVFSTLEKQLNINIRATSNNLGNLQYGGSWILDDGNVNIKDIYFNNNILNYQYLFFMPTLTIQANNYTKEYDNILFNNTSATYEGFIDKDNVQNLYGSIIFTGTFINGINIGTYTIIASGITSNKYYINYEIGTLTINQKNLIININNYTKVYDNTNILLNYSINYTGLVDNDQIINNNINSNLFTGSLILSGSFTNAINIGNYEIIPTGLYSLNYNIIYKSSILTIIQTPLLIIANNMTKIYDGIPFYGNNDVIYDGFMGNDTKINLSGSLYFIGNGQGSVNTGTYQLTPQGYTSINYNIFFIDGTLTIYNDLFLIAGNNFIKFYNNLFFSNPTIYYTNNINDLSGSLLFNGNFLNNNAGSYSIKPTGYTSNNHSIIYYDGLLVIELTEIKIIANDYVKVYDTIPFIDNGFRLDNLQGVDNSSNFTGTMINLGTSSLALNVGTYNIIPSNIFSSNYTILFIPGTLKILLAPLYIITTFYFKTYDGTNIIYPINIIGSISGILNNENITIFSYNVNFRNVNIGYQFIDISNITLSGITLKNYYIVNVPQVIGLILPQPLIINFFGGNKIFDNLVNAFGLTWTISGIINNENITLSSYIANYKNPSVGRKQIDISNIILVGDTINNYIIIPVPSIDGLIYQNLITINFYGGDKIYNGYNNTGLLSYTISNVVNGETLTISSYVALFRDYNTGIILIDISNIILSGPTAYTYTVSNIKPFYAIISSKIIYLKFSGGTKIYDGTRIAGNMLYSISGIEANENVGISSYIALFKNNQVGYSFIDISSILLNGYTCNNYIIADVPILTSFIDYRNLYILFTGGDKIYDSTYIPGNINYTISNIVNGETITIILRRLIQTFQKNIIGLQLIDVSGIILFGPTITNYSFSPVPAFNANIYKKDLTITFTGGAKIYDSTTYVFPNKIFATISGMVLNEYITISSYIVTFQNKNYGNQLIDMSNIALFGPLFNYNLIAVPPINAFISKKTITGIFYSGNKIYDQTIIVTQPIYGQLYDTIIGDDIYIYSYDSFYKGSYAGLHYIDISNITLSGITGDNYYLKPVQSIFSIILQKSLDTNIINSEKIYDGTTIKSSSIIITLSGIINNDIVSLSTSYIGTFKNINVGVQYVDISYCVLTGFSSKNYYVSAIPSCKSYIYAKQLLIIFNSVGKIYDGTTNINNLTYNISGIIFSEKITVSSFIASFETSIVKLQFCNINNIILNGSTINNYYFQNSSQIQVNIKYKILTIILSGGNKYYDRTINTLSSLIYSLSGVVDNEIINIINYNSTFNDYNIGIRRITLNNASIDGLTVNNYFFNPVASIIATIIKKNIDANILNGSKNYDGTNSKSSTMLLTLNGILNNDIVLISQFYTAFFNNINVGEQILNASNCTIYGGNSANYYISPIQVFKAFIYPKLIIINFSSTGKYYDGTNSINNLTYNISGIVSPELITISSFTSQLKAVEAKIQLCDISNIILYGLNTNNYYFNNISPIQVIIYNKKLNILFSGGDKFYDNTTTTTTSLLYTISGIINNENIIVITYTSKFSIYNVGLIRIDVSNIILGGITITNYLLQPMVPIYALIKQINIVASFTGGNKIYNGSLDTGILNITLLGILANDIINLYTYTSRFRNGKIGYQIIDFTNASLDQQYNDYILSSILSISAYIFPKQLSISFNGGNKIYNGNYDTGPIIYYINGIINPEIITISSFKSFYKNNTVGNQNIDISNVNLFGPTINNYIINNINSINGYISPASLIVKFTSNDKIYDGTNGTNNINIILQGIFGNDIVKINKFDSFYNTINIGLNRIDISNIILIGNDINNYIISPIIPINSNILPRLLNITFTGGDKIYDKKSITGNIFYSISGMVNSDLITISQFTSKYKNINAGNNLIDISNIKLDGINSINYIISSVGPIIGNIIRKSIQANFTNINKIYDRKIDILNTISYFILNIIDTDLIYILSFTGYYRNNIAGNIILDISNVILNDNLNYILDPIIPINAIIFKRRLIINFYGGNKIYDGTQNTGFISYDFSNMIKDDDINVVSFNANYRFFNIGYQFIDISNIILSGLDVNNYILVPTVPIIGYIGPKLVNISFTSNNKIYDTTLIAYVSNPLISGALVPISISSYTAYYNDIYTGINKTFYVSNIILSDSNYNPPLLITLSSSILPKLINLISNGDTKIYDKTIVATLNNSYLSGLFINDVNFVSISNYISTFDNNNAGFNKTIYIVNINIIGQLAYNYYILSTSTTGIILPKPIFGTAIGLNKNFDNNNNASVINLVLYNIIDNDSVKILNYYSYFINQNIEIQKKIIIDNIQLDNNNYTISSIITNGNITYPILFNIITLSSIIYKDPNYLTIKFDPIWEYNQYGNDEFSGIYIKNYDSIITTKNGSILLNNNYIYQSNYIINSLSMSNINNGIAICNSGIILITTNTWNSLSIININTNNFNGISKIISKNVIIVGSNGIIYKSIDNGNSWTAQKSNVLNKLNDIYSLDINNIYIVGDNGLLLKSLDGGNNWSKYILGNMNLNSIFMYDINNGYIAGNNGNIFATTDGNTWIKQTDSLNNNLTNNDLKSIFVLNNNETICVGSNGVILRTFNRGINWIKYISGTINSLNKVIMIDTNMITIIGSNGLQLNYFLYTPGVLNIYDQQLNNNLIYSLNITSSIITLPLNTLIVKNYYLYATFNPNKFLKYGQTTTSIIFLTIRPIFYYTVNQLVILYERTNIIPSIIPNIDQSGGLFSSDNILIDINSGIIYFDTNIKIGNYNYNIYYGLNNTTSTIQYNLMIVPNFYYLQNNINIVYKTSGYSIIPYFNLPNGYFTFQDISGRLIKNNLISLSSTSGIIFINSNIPIGSYTIQINYTLNNVFNSSLYYINIIPYFNYTINTANIDYLMTGYSILPIIDQSGGIFQLIDQSNNQILYNFVTINNNGLLNFTNNNLNNIGNNKLIIKYTLNNMQSLMIYNLNLSPLISFASNIKVLSYNHSIIDGTVTPYLNPIGGFLNIIDQSGSLISNGYIQLYNNTIIFNNNIDTGLYSFLLTYTYKNAPKSYIYNLIIQPSITYSISTTIINNTSQVTTYSLQPSITPIGGIFNISELNNNLIQLGFVNINYNNGIISFSPNIISGNYIFNITYLLNNIPISTKYYLNITLSFNYPIQYTNLLYNITGSSVLPKYSPLGGIFTISSLINQKISINQQNGLINFKNNIDVNNYLIIITYSINNIFMSVTYGLSIIPQLNYSIISSILLYERLTDINSVLPLVNQQGGIFTIIDIASNITNLIFINSLSGIITFPRLIDSGIYSFNVIYTLNAISNSIIYNLIIKPNILYLLSYQEILCDQTKYNYIDKPYVNKIGGSFSLLDISGFIVSLGYAIIDSISGIITLLPNIYVGYYNFKIIYTLNNSFNTTNYNIVVKPIIIYNPNINIINYGNSSNSIYPYYNQTLGYFTIQDLSSNLVQLGLITINNFGLIQFTATINIGNYNFLVIYKLNNIINSTVYILNIIPNLFYPISQINIIYNSSNYSESPIYSQAFGTFSINDISSSYVYNNIVNIDFVTGIIFFNIGINVGIFNFKVTYTLNNTSITTIYQLNIIPILNYQTTDINNINNYISNNKYISYSIQPYVEQLNGNFNITDINSSLVNNNQVLIDIISGIIIFNIGIDVGNYSFQIIYTLNNVFNTFIYNLVVKPNLSYSIQNIILNYGVFSNSVIPTVDSLGIGIFNIQDLSGSLVLNKIIFIDNKMGIINFNNLMYPDYYSFLITYKLNNVISSTIYYLTVIPILNYSIPFTNLVYDSINYSCLPITLPIKGVFSISVIKYNTLSNIIINSKTGLITFNSNIYPNSYNLQITYSINNINNIFNYLLTVYPYLNYSEAVNTILYNNINPIYSLQPNYQPIGGSFTMIDLSGLLIKNNSVNIDISGIIYFGNKNKIGSYSLVINYTVNNITSFVIYTLNIIPNLSYTPSIIYILYGEIRTINPYYDQSGGLFSFNDIAGSLITNNLINLDISFGVINITNNLSVGLFNINIIYTLNNISNNTNIIIYILPIINYFINNLSIKYNTNNNSIIPYYIQIGGTFSLNNTYNNSIYIDINNGIIYFTNNLDVGNYIIIINYTLNNVFNTTKYYLTVFPIIDFTYSYLFSEYNTRTITSPVIFFPLGGNFLLKSNDISNNYIINYYINNNLIYVDSSGCIIFAKSIAVGIYNISITYILNNVSATTNFEYTMRPLINYSINYTIINYRDLSFSIFPLVQPSGGIFIASVSRINLINTGISINRITGVIRFGLINAGNWAITVKYIVNNVSTTTAYKLSVIADIVYIPPYLVIPFNTITSVNAPIVKNSGGTYTSSLIVTGLTLNTATGALYFNNIVCGIYFIPITYNIFNVDTVINFTLIVNPIISYLPINIQSFYTQHITSSLPLIQPLSGIFSATFGDVNKSMLMPSITIDTISGIISFDNTVRVGVYPIAVSYIINEADQITQFIVSIYPILKYNIGFLNIIYGSYYYSELPNINPRGGNFISLNNLFNINSLNGIIQISNIMNVGIYTIPINYTYNNLSTLYTYNVTIYPLLNYSTTSLELIYGYSGNSVQPIAQELNGQFTFITVSGTINISYNLSYISSGDQYIYNGVILNGYTGIFNFGAGILVGRYTFYIAYTYNNLSSFTLYTLTVKPAIIYKFSSVTLDYNTSYQSQQPFVDQSGGYFIFNNINDYKSEASNITINNNTGIMNFKSGITVGSINIIISYTVNLISNYTIFNLIIKPIYYYINYIQRITYQQKDDYVITLQQSELPIVYLAGGKFNVYYYDNISNDNLFIDQMTGIIYFNIIDVGIYNIILNYTYNNSFVKTNYQLIVQPLINYIYGGQIIKYGYSSYSEIPSALQTDGIFGFENISDLNFQKSKIGIDISSGIIFFNSYINLGNYNIFVFYIKNNIKNIFNYNLKIIPLIAYSISGQTLIYNNYSNFTINSTIPINIPIKGTFYFTDFSNNYPINITINSNNGLITINNNIPVNNYNIGVTYSILNLINLTQYYLSILPNFNYINNQLIIIYDMGTTNSTLPVLDPSGGLINIIYPINNSLINNFVLKKNGLIIFNNYINVDDYNILLSYTFNNNVAYTNYYLTIQPKFYYLESNLILTYNLNSNSSQPIISPYGGTYIFTIESLQSNNIDISAAYSFININPINGIINVVSGLNSNIYNLIITYTYNNVSSIFNYTISILNNFYYDIQKLLINYGSIFKTANPKNYISNGSFTIPLIYINKGILIDISSGSLNFTNKIKVNNYLIPITYTYQNTIQMISYDLTIIPNIIYDISSLTILYNSTLKINKPFINPNNGTFSINYFTIDNSGYIFLDNQTVNIFNLIITYTVNNINNIYRIKLIILPIIDYFITKTNMIYNINYNSNKPFVNPQNGIFSINNILNDKIVINNNGVISFNNNTNIGNYNIIIYYAVNNIINSYIYNFVVNPYINYDINNTIIDGGKSGQSIIPSLYPSNGFFYSDNNLIKNKLIILDNSGQLFFTNNIKIDNYQIIIKYIVTDLSSIFIYNLIVNPYLYYDTGYYDFGIKSQSKLPIVNSTIGKFIINFIIDKPIRTSSIILDISSGLIFFDSLLAPNNYNFNINYIVNNLTKSFLYSFTIQPIINYNNIIINYFNNIVVYPIIILPLNGSFSSNNINLYGIIDSNTGAITISNYILINKYILDIRYSYNSVIKNIQITLIVKPTISYSEFSTLIFSEIGSSVSPTINSNDLIQNPLNGIFNVSNLPLNVLFDNMTGIFTYQLNINIGIYSMNVVYIYNDISSNTVFILSVLPFIAYSDNTTLIYGVGGESVIPYVYPPSGIFSIINSNDGITIDPIHGTVYFSNLILVNTYVITIEYIINNIINNITLNLDVLPVQLEAIFIPYDKIYDGTASVKFLSNKLVNVVNDDIVFISKYNASFLTPSVGINIPIFIYKIILDGKDAKNYDIQNVNDALGNIYYIIYNPNKSVTNIGTIDKSVPPSVTDSVISPSFIISNPQDGITIDPYGIIMWDDTLSIGTYNIIITIYNKNISFNINYTLIVTNNLYNVPLKVISPILNNITIDTANEKLQYNASSGLAYVIDSVVTGFIGSFVINGYNQNDELLHDLNELQQFTFYLPNADPSNNLITYELNDDGTLKYSNPIQLIYNGNHHWNGYIRYLSQFNVHDISILDNSPPVFNPKGRRFYNNIVIYLSAVINSIIYYTIDGTIPTINSLLYNNLTGILLSNSTTIKAFAVTQRYTNSNISTSVYVLNNIPCILSGTLIKTPTGYQMIDNLVQNDLILTYANRIVPIINILQYKINDPKNKYLPVIIPKHFFGFNIPNKDTYISENHAVRYNDEFIYATLNKNLFKKLIIEPLYFHIELPNYFTDDLVANNMPIESWSGNKVNNIYFDTVREVIINNISVKTIKKYKMTKVNMFKRIYN